MAHAALSIISHYYNHPQKVAAQLAHWELVDPGLRPFLEFILVDDCSEEPLATYKTDLNLRAFRITTDIPWNQAGARNLGAFHASGEWGLFFDIDQKLNLEALPAIIGNLKNFDPMTMYHLKMEGLCGSSPEQKLTNHPNTFLVNMQTFRTFGMYDEDFAGYYGYEDLYLPRVWETAGGKRALLADFNFFENIGFRTNNLDRDAERNRHLAIFKLATGCKNSPGMLRFDWRQA